VIETTPFKSYEEANSEISKLTQALSKQNIDGIALIIVVDDSSFVAADFDNFIWVTFTRSNPSYDVYGVNSFIENKHWGCRGPLVVDARLKPHHAPVLEEYPAVEKKIDELGAKGGCLHGII
jgi:4-hydroxy-3-polyprenylbenzoate decarboxylase